MSHVDLTGLPIGSPIGFMAALGLLRVCAQDHRQAVTLSWTGTCARLQGITRDALVDLLDLHLRGRSLAPEFNLEVPLKGGLRGPVAHLREIPAADYRAAARAWRGDARALGFLAGFGTDAVVNDKGHVARTRFDFSSGQQRLAQEFRQLALSLDPSEQRARGQDPNRHHQRLANGLFGGPFEPQHSLGWDPATLLAHAHQAQAPTDTRPPGQPLLIWLAVESLPLHPVVPVGRRAVTTGFVGARTYVWPQWAEPLDLAEVRLLRQRTVGTQDGLDGIDGLGGLVGITALWSSGITSVGQYGFFLPATRLPRGAHPASPAGPR
ncbi:type I-G CRISPR-associated protein, Cas3-extension family [Leptothrix sp. BB-4]